MLPAWSAADVRAAEKPLLAAGVPLMQRAAFALHVAVLDELRRRDAEHRRRHGAGSGGTAHGGRVLVLVGPGNNGGDALHAAALLARRGVAVTAALAASRVHAEGLVAARRAGVVVLADDEPVAAVAAGRADVVVDGLLGIGADGSGLRGRAADLVRALLGRADRPRVVAVDVPSGIGVDDGRLDGVVLSADLTVTFGVAKPGLLLPPACRAAGRLQVVDLGLHLAGAPDVRRLDEADVARLWPVPGTTAQKYTRGVLGVVAGTPRYPGAAVLATSGAVAAGVGMVRFVDEEPAGPADEGASGARGSSAGGGSATGPAWALGPLAAAVLAARPEVVVGPGRVQAWAVGSGVDPADEGRARQIERVLDEVADGTPAVLDAGALPALARRVAAGRTLGPHVVLTPHAGELAELLTALGAPVERSAVEAEPLRRAREVQARTGATVLLKGATTLVVGPGETYAQAEAPPWLATAGAGDVLAGVLGALLAGRADDVRREPALAARLAAAAALVHGRAAERANPGGPVSGLGVAHAVPAAVAALPGLAAGPR